LIYSEYVLPPQNRFPNDYFIPSFGPSYFGPTHLSMAQTYPSRVRLGEFELNLETGELRSRGAPDAGVKTVLSEQPFQILKLLVERSGKIVSRDEIRRMLWSDDTIVDFDHSISVAIRILRKAFGDSAGRSRYIETIASRGYRLLVKTEFQETSSGADPDQGRSKSISKVGDLAGKKVSHYRVLDVLGGGGMGIVYRAEDLKLGRAVALKFLTEEIGGDVRARQRFKQEARTASALNHPNICTIYEIEEHEGHPFIVMELLEGQTFRQRLDASAKKRLGLAELMNLAVQVCSGLQAAHDKGIVHRDIKPANLFLTNNDTVKILDFGLAKLMLPDAPSQLVLAPPAEDRRQLTANHTSPTTRKTGMGTSGYMSPEQIRNEKLDSRTDLFSLGVTLYEAATGYRPFTGETEDRVREAILSDSPTTARSLNPAIPSSLDVILAKTMEKDPSLRPQSAKEIERGIERIQGRMRPRRKHELTWLAACTLLTLSVAVTWMYRYLHRPPLLSQGDTVVLSTSNQTGDPVFDEALYSASVFALQQTPYINVLGSYRVSDVLGELHLPPAPWIAPQVASRVCLRTGSKLVIAASIAGQGNGFHVETVGIDCQSSKVLASAQQKADGRSDIIHILGLCLVQLRRKLGEPGSSISKFNQPLETATSASPEALQLLTDGYIRQVAGDGTTALSDYQRAVALDPGFALGYAAEAFIHNANGDRDEAAMASQKAYDLRDQLTLPGRFQVEQVYYENVLGDLEKDCSVLAEWVHIFPADFIARNNHSDCLLRLGRHDESLAEAREAARLFPSVFSYAVWMSRCIYANRLDEAIVVYESAQDRHFDGPSLHETRAYLAFLQGDDRAWQEQLDWSRGKPSEPDILDRWAWVQAYHGHHRDALRLLRNVKELDADRPTLDCEGDFNATMALWNAQQGFTRPALQIVKQSLPSEKAWGQRFRLALASAQAGDVGQAQVIVDEARRRFPLDTLVQNYQLPVIEAAIKMHQDDPRDAVDVLQRTMPYDLSINCASIDSLYSGYIRGQAYLEMKQGDAALAEFQKLQDHPGIVGMVPIGALAKLQMARAYRLTGNDAIAKEYYEQFLSLWKNADTDIPIYQKAKAEYAQLRQSGTKVQ
jgi:serine/threonine protein kinase/tetratricopeptide (TPR) repeat protein